MNELDRAKTAETLIKLRGEKTQSEVAQAIGVTRAAYSLYEKGKRTPRDTVKVKLAQYYGRSVKYIFF